VGRKSSSLSKNIGVDVVIFDVDESPLCDVDVDSCGSSNWPGEMVVEDEVVEDEVAGSLSCRTPLWELDCADDEDDFDICFKVIPPAVVFFDFFLLFSPKPLRRNSDGQSLACGNSPIHSIICVWCDITLLDTCVVVVMIYDREVVGCR